MAVIRPPTPSLTNEQLERGKIVYWTPNEEEEAFLATKLENVAAFADSGDKAIVIGAIIDEMKETCGIPSRTIRPEVRDGLVFVLVAWLTAHRLSPVGSASKQRR